MKSFFILTVSSILLFSCSKSDYVEPPAPSFQNGIILNKEMLKKELNRIDTAKVNILK